MEEGQNSGNESHKIKSKRGGGIDVFVKNKVAWPHEHILGGPTRQRVTYDQLNITQFVQGFVKNVLEEPSETNRERMLHYLSDLMEDASDFSWANAKASHAVLLCEMERGSVSWSDTSRIDRIRRANAQKHNPPTKNWAKILKWAKGHGTVNRTSKVCVSIPRTTSQMVRFTSTFALIV